MTEFYYTVRGKSGNKEGTDGFFTNNWTFPPIFSGKVLAENKIEAKKLIEQNYNKKLPMRVLTKDLNDNEFLLKITDMTDNHYLQSLFEIRICKNDECKQKFRRIDLFNNINTQYKGNEYCSDGCKDRAYELFRKQLIEDYNNPEKDNPNGFFNMPIIYKITNKKTKWCYIGQTTQSFTLRWWQHINWGKSDCKFHKAIQESIITDWIFEVIEIVEDKNNLNNRESYYIKHYNSIDHGYNSVKVQQESEADKCLSLEEIK